MEKAHSQQINKGKLTKAQMDTDVSKGHFDKKDPFE